MITNNVTAQYAGNNRVLLRVNSSANAKNGSTAQTAGCDTAAFNNEIAAISYANLVNQTGILFKPVQNNELVKDVFELASRDNQT